jgi:hypothetical protein
MYRALATVFAGYWRPALPTRLLVSLFLLLVRAQKRVALVPRRKVRSQKLEVRSTDNVSSDACE